MMKAVRNVNYTDGWKLRCNYCKNDRSLRADTVLEPSKKASLSSLILLLRGYKEMQTMASTSRMSGICFDTVSAVYRACRQRVYAYMQAHPVHFDEEELVEVDECHVKMLQPEEGERDEEAKAAPPVWIIGMIGRTSGYVALDIANDHKMATMRKVMNPHLNRSSTVTLSDKHKSFSFLERERDHFWVTKHKGDRRMWIEKEEVLLLDYCGPNSKVEFNVHTNTIEGFWSHMRRELRGAQRSTIHLYLAEIMFRRLKIDHTVVWKAF